MATAPPPAVSEKVVSADDDRPVWQLPWLTPTWCRVILVGLLMLQVLPRLHYLASPGAIDLAPDEAQYWVWAKHLDWSYYSKGPMVALVVAASTAVLGDTMFAVRFPTIIIGVLSTLMTYGLTRKLFGSEKLALGAVALNYLVPMFIAGSMFMTIDPPYVLFWSAATVLFALAVIFDRKWAWPLAGLMVGCSFLAKYAAFFLYAGLLAALLADKTWRWHLRTPWPYVALAVSLLCTFPVVYWNALHGWVSAAHVKADTTKGFNPAEPLQFALATAVLLGPGLTPLVIGGIWRAWRWGGANPPADNPPHPSTGPVSPPEQARRARFLMLTALPFAAVVFASSFFTKAQLNWTAPLWFSLLIVAAWFISTRLVTLRIWKRWRGCLWATVVFALVLIPIGTDIPRFYPAFAWVQTNLLKKNVRTREWEQSKSSMTREQRQQLTRREVSLRVWDPTARLRGWKELAQDLDQRRLAMGPDTFLLVQDYFQAAAVEFYAPSRPKTYTMGVYIDDPKSRGRRSQWNIWPDRNLDRGTTRLTGQNAIYLSQSPLWPTVTRAFDRVEELPPHTVWMTVNGTDYFLNDYRVWACYGFKGFDKPSDGAIAW